MNERYLLLLLLATMAVVGWSAGVYFTEPLSYAIDAVLFWPIYAGFLYARNEARR